MPVGDCGRVGDMQDVNLMFYFPDNGSLSQRPAVLEAAAGLLGNILLRPRRVGGRLYGPYVDRAKERVSALMGQHMTDLGPLVRPYELMFPREPFGIPYGGSASALDRVSVGTLTPYHRDLIATAQVEIFYCGSVDDSRLLPIIRGAFHSLKDRPVRPAPKQVKLPKKPRLINAEGAPTFNMNWRLPPATDAHQYAAQAVLAEYITGDIHNLSCGIILSKGLMIAHRLGYDEDLSQILRDEMSIIASGRIDMQKLEIARQRAGEYFRKKIDLCVSLDTVCRDLAVCNIGANPGDLAALMTVIDEKHIMAAAASAVEDTVLIVSPADDAAEEGGI